MLLSFSVDSMLPMIRAGLRQAANEDVGTERVKRQTIRQRGPRAEVLLTRTILDGVCLFPLHLWWKSRTPGREFLGKVERFQLWPVLITNNGGMAVFSVGLKGIALGDCWTPDGFDSHAEFREYFVPNKGDRYDGVLFKW